MSENIQHPSQRYYRQTVADKKARQQYPVAARAQAGAHRHTRASVSSQMDLLDSSMQATCSASNQYDEQHHQQARQQQQPQQQQQQSHHQQLKHHYQHTLVNANASCLQQMDSQCKQIAQLKLNNPSGKPNKSKKSRKLLGSKSLSQLIMPKAFMFSRETSSAKGNNSHGTIARPTDATSETPTPAASKAQPKPTAWSKLIKGKSFTNSSYQQHDGSLSSAPGRHNSKPGQAMDSVVASSAANSGSQLSLSSQLSAPLGPQMRPTNQSDSMLACFPRQSTSNSLPQYRLALGANKSLTPTNLSPIVGSLQRPLRGNAVGPASLNPFEQSVSEEQGVSVLLMGDEDEDQVFGDPMGAKSGFSAGGCGAELGESGGQSLDCNDHDNECDTQQGPRGGRGQLVASSAASSSDAENADAIIDCDNTSSGRQEKPAKRKSYRALKTTALVLRDVKNSLGLRMRAKHESQAFRKLAEEIATPPATATKLGATKLYSPFNIYTPKSGPDVIGRHLGPANNGPAAKTKARKRLNLMTAASRAGSSGEQQKGPHNDTGTRNNGLAQHDHEPTDSGYGSMLERHQGTTHEWSPKDRIAFRHKKHLMQASKQFQFDSPTGRFRQTVRDVEQLQQCIEDISKAIEARAADSQ